MSAKRQNKRRKPSKLFDLDQIEASVKASDVYVDEIRQHITALGKVNLEHILAEKIKLTEDEALCLAASKVGMRNLLELKDALLHVPENVTRVENGSSMRLNYVLKVFHALARGDSCGTEFVSLEKENLKSLCTFVESYCPDFLKKQDSKTRQKNLWKLTRDEGAHFNKFLSPPISNCLKCSKNLSMHNNPSKATLFTSEGPVPCSKISLECRDCSTRFGVASFADDLGTHFYPQDFAIDVVEISNVTYMDKMLYRWIPSLSNHCWVSFCGFSEAYNDVNADEIEWFRLATHGCQEFSHDPEASCNENTGISNTLPGELSAKAVAQSFWRREVEKELQEICLREKWSFGEKRDEFSGSNDDAMEFIDAKRCDNLYYHDCSINCRSKGCGNLFVADGNWKLRYAHCMWKVPIKLPEFGEINYPRICPLTPKRGHAFCESHCKQAVLQGYPSELRPFLKQCGISKEDIDQALEGMSDNSCWKDSNLEQLNKHLNECGRKTFNENECNASTFQGTTDFLVKNPGFVVDEGKESEIACNKDTGGLKTLQCWSRGMFFVVTAGGHIEYWQPLYRSESPTQAFIVLVLWLYRKFNAMLRDGKTEEEVLKALSSTCLSYDNMCHVDGMKVAKKDLPFPSPLNKAWKTVPKVIDRLHLRNHVDPKCKRLYNPDDKIPPQYNTMACEQTFVWASRFKKIICAMPHLHQFFFLHRLVKYRNLYTEKCHKSCKEPVLPKIGKKPGAS